MHKYLIVVSCLLLSLSAFGQSLPPSPPPCASDMVNEALFLRNREAKNRMQAFDEALASGWTSQIGNEAVYTIPVVVHIIHNNGPENITNNQVLDAIQHMNDAFANTGVYNPNTGVDVGIEFCLAVRDPQGMASTGINRVQSPLTNMTLENDDLALKNLIRWDPTQYLNIWLVGSINSSAAGPGVAGYAYFPSSHGQPEDGIVNEAQFFGSSTDNSKIHVHEAGHYLGLYHTFQGGCTNNNCLTDGDRVCDTPPDANTGAVSCGATVNSCTTDDDDTSINNPFRPVANGGLGDQGDMYINYMDYGDDVCQNAFTAGQKGRMVNALTGLRNSLLSSPGCQSVCSNPVTAAFSAGSTVINPGTVVSFSNQSTGATQYDWKVDGVSFSSAANPNYTFNTIGMYDVTLLASSSGPGCIDSTTITVDVVCTAQASFTSSATQINPGDVVFFTNTSTGATSQTWLKDGVAVSTVLNYGSTFNTPGGYRIQLVVSDANCSDTSTTAYIQVGQCGNLRDNVWLFGEGSGLDFSSGSPVVLNNTGIVTQEGGATICDNAGNPLFHCNNITVYDRNYNPMPNGSGLMSHRSSTMGSLITPNPGNPDQYYVFTAAASENQNSVGIRYNIVDMTLNGGLGDVTSTKNVLLMAPCGEKLTAHYQADRQSIWVVTHEVNGLEYRAFSVTAAGVDHTPVVSVPAGGDSTSVLGGMRFSHDGKRIACTRLYGPNRGVEICDFDQATGTVSNLIFVPLGLVQPYLMEFSDNNQMLYVTTWSASLFQINLGAGSTSDIIASLLQLDNNHNSDLRMGPDKKIYVSKGWRSFLGVVNSPNTPGAACNYMSTQLTLPEDGGDGLNNLFAGYDLPLAANISGPETVCLGSGNTIWTLTGLNPADSVDWTFQGPGSVVSESSTSLTVNLTGPGTGSIIVSQVNSCGLMGDTLYFEAIPGLSFDMGTDTVLCPGDSVVLDAGNGYSSYLWQNASTAQTFTANGPGTYTVEVTTTGGCAATDSIVIAPYAAASSLNLGPDTDICPSGIVNLDAGPGFLSYQWQDGSTNQNFTAWLPGTYSVTVTDACGGVANDLITLSPANVPALNLGPDTLWCENSPFILTAQSGFTSYLWHDNSTAATFTVTGPGNYWVEALSPGGCLVRDDFVVSPCVAAEDVLVAGNFILFPNPNNGEFTLRFGERALRKGLHLRAFDAHGRVVLTREIAATGGPRDLPVNLTNQALGIYLLMLEAGNEQVTVKVEIRR